MERTNNEDLKREMPRIVRFIPIMFVLSLLIIIYTIYLQVHCIPMLQNDIEDVYRDHNSRKQGIIHFLFANFITVLLLWCFTKTVMTEPGSIPRTDNWKKRPRLELLHEPDEFGRPRFCRFEKLFKPDRCHFCRPMNRNVLKMDHYCPWVGNCIGYNNYKFFLQTLLYSSIGTIFISSTMYYTIEPMISNPNIPYGELFMAIFGVCLSGATAMVLVPFFTFHIILSSFNFTTIEICHELHGDRRFISKYNQGPIINWFNIMGDNYLSWILPFGGPKGDGLHFATNPNASIPSLAQYARMN